MLTICIGDELFDESKGEFLTKKEFTLQLEHSLISISKWEAKWHKPFLGDYDRTDEETLDYIKCMTLNQNVNPEIYNHLSKKDYQAIHDYIHDPMTATWFAEDKGKDNKKNKEVLTSELIYYSMIAHTIPMECQKWHLNRLIVLIRICNDKNKPTNKTPKKDLVSKYAEMNKRRREAWQSKG